MTERPLYDPRQMTHQIAAATGLNARGPVLTGDQGEIIDPRDVMRSEAGSSIYRAMSGNRPGNVDAYLDLHTEPSDSLTEAA